MLRFKTFIIIFASITLIGCFSNTPKRHVAIIDKSTGQENNLARFSEDIKTKKSIVKKSIKKPIKKPLKTILAKKNESVPVSGKIIKTFSKKHQGLTFNTQPGQAVHAIRNGVVVYSGDKIKIHGKMIIIKHPLGFYSSYTRNQNLKVQKGDKVKKRQIIALTGTDNFYFEMKKFETPINPLKYLK